MEEQVIPIPIELIINQFAQTIPGNEEPRKLYRKTERSIKTKAKERIKGRHSEKGTSSQMEGEQTAGNAQLKVGRQTSEKI